MNNTTKNANNLVSIIIPAYNSEKTLDICLRSLSGQTSSRDLYEVLVIDDGSSDNTREVVKKYGARYFYQKNLGPAAARNKGIEEAGGEILLFTDADCEVEKNWVEEMCKPFSEKDIVGVKGIYRSKQKEIVARFAQLEYEEKYEKMWEDESIDFVDTYSAGFRKSIIEKFGGFSSQFKEASGEDTELSFRIAKEGYKMVFAPTAVVYHQHPNTLAKYLKRKFKIAYWRVLIYKRHPDKMVKDSHTPQTLKLQILLFYILMLGLLSLLFTGMGWGIMGVSLTVFLLTSIPFTVKVARKDFPVSLCSPPLLFLRAGVFSLGLLRGMWDCFFMLQKGMKNA